MEKIYIPYGKHSITEEEISAVSEVLRNRNLTQGDTVPEFEYLIADRVGTKYAVAVNSATSALHIACLALGVSKGDEVWTSSISFVASANCGRYCGASVDFVDIDLQTGLMDCNKLEKKLIIGKKRGKVPKVVIPVHLAGTSCDMARIKELSEEYGFKVIEDASHAIGGTYMGYSVGSCKYSDITVFSFHPVKIITTGEGGVATSNDPELTKRMIKLRSHGITKDEKEFTKASDGPWAYEQQMLGFNYRLTDIQAAIGKVQIKKLDRFVKKRNKIAEIYRKELIKLPGRILMSREGILSSYHLAVFVLNENSQGAHRQLFEYLREKGIGVQLHYSPIHLQPYYKKDREWNNLKESEKYAKRAVSLPIS